jgi:V8-like Glu-specific endopeptidase
MFKSLIIAECFLLTVAGSAMAQLAAPPHAVTSTESGSSQSYWTPQRMRNAKPRPMPPHNPQAIEPSASSTPVQKPVTSQGPGEAGAPPSVNPPEAVQLGKPQRQSYWQSLSREEAPASSSSFGFPFTTAEVQSYEAANYPFAIAGVLFFTEQGAGDFVCSASSVKRGVVVAAGHCVAAPATANSAAHYFTNWMFVPGYTNGTAPFGTWFPTYVDTTSEWYYGDGSVPNAQDVGMLDMADQGGVRVGDYTGYFGYQTEALAGQHITMLGYPCNLDNCAVMIRTDAGDSVAGGNNTYQYGSAGSGGYSGGPWLVSFGIVPTATGNEPINYTALGLNQIVAVTSYGPTNSNGYLGASQLDNSFVTLLTTMCSLQVDVCQP